MAVPTTLVIDATQQTLEVTTSRDAVSLQGRSIETGTPTDGEVMTYSTSSSEWIYQTITENVDDRVAALIQDSAGGGLTWTYDDSAGTLTPAYVGDSTLVTSGALNSGSITSGFSSIDVGSGAITTTGTVSGGVLTGTLSTASQTNITGVGTIATGIWNAGAVTSSGALNVAGAVNNFYRAANNGNPEIHLGASTAEDMYIQTVYDSGAQTLAYVSFVSRVASGTADKGEFRFQPDESLVLTIDDGGLEVTGGVEVSTTLAVTGAISGSTSLALATGATVTGIDNGSLGSSATLLATQGAIKTYIDAQVTAQDLDIISDSGTIDIDLDSESLTLAGGTGLASSASSTTVTFAIDSTVATLSGSQTLTNKTIAGGSNTLSAIANSSLTNSTVSYGGVSLSLGGTDSTPAFNLSDADSYPGDSSLVTCGTIASGTWNGSVITGAYIDATSSPLASTKVWIGSASNVAAEFALSGNATMTAGGVVTVSTAAACSGLAATATALATARAINGTDFDGTAAITVTAAAGTVTGATLNSGVTASSLTSVGTLTSLALSGNLTLADDDKAVFGTGSDLEIYHDGSNSIISEGGPGGLLIYTAGVATSGFYKIGGEALTTFEPDGAVTLYYDNAVKLATVTGGINITGDTDTDTLTVSGDVTLAATQKLYLDGGGNSFLTEASGDRIEVHTGGAERLRITDTDVQCNQNLVINTTQKLFLDGGSNTFLSEYENDRIGIYCNSVIQVDIRTDEFLISQDATFNSDVKMNFLPTSDPGAAGTLYNDSGTMKISAG